ncbi:MAG: AbiV family abortive infection protein [Rhodoglobus sp.]
MMKPTAARAFWFALLQNAALTIVDANALYPSPRAQSLVVIAQEEVGKAVWVQKAFRPAWGSGDEMPREIPELVRKRKGKALNHLAKLNEAFDFWTALIEDPVGGGAVEIEIVRELDPEFLATYFDRLASEDNEAKKRGFYVDALPDGSFMAPHKLDRPLLRAQIWNAADMAKWCLDEDQLFASLAKRPPFPPTSEIEALLEPVLALGWEE